MDELKRTLDDFIMLYKLEPQTKDIFVEGISDKLVIENFIKENKLIDVKVIEVHEIDFSIYNGTHQIPKCNNKGKLIQLNNILETEINETLDIIIIVDIDFDEINNSIVNSQYLLYTDYNSLELYLFNESTIDTFFRNILHGFQLSSTELIDKITPILTDCFLIRLTLNKDFNVPDNCFTPFSKTIKINKKNLEITLTSKEHILKVLNNTKKTSLYEEYISHFEDLKNKLKIDHKKHIRGHDFIDIFFQFINNIKNDIGLSLETFERSLFLCLDYKELKKEPLFQNIINKYS